jgi:DNA-binding SARP family transcriptional activator
VSRATLIRWAWSAKEPGNPKAALQNAISRLRKLIGEDIITTLPWGYVLRADSNRLDLVKFRELSSTAAQVASAGEDGLALSLLDEALGLWRRPVLANVVSDVLLADTLPHLTEQYLTAVERRAALRLRLRRPAGLPEELAELLRDHPFRETMVGHLMVALYQTRRRTEGLTAFHSLRVALSRELGIAPSPALQALYETLLQDAPMFDRWLGGSVMA